MNPDPIVKEVREAGAKLAAEAGDDVHRFFENLRRVEKKCDKPLVREPVAKSSWRRPGLWLIAENAIMQSKPRRSLTMPVIARFYGIVIKMYFSQSEHGVAHFHAVYGEFNGVFNIETLEMMEGDLPLRAQRLVRDWALQYQQELLQMWQTNEYKHLPGLE